MIAFTIPTVLGAPRSRRTLVLGVLASCLAVLATLLPVGSAQAVPPQPDVPLPSGTDIIDEYQGQTLCDPTPKEGTLALRDELWRTYGSAIWAGISRDCAVTWDRGISEHKDGRAIDWGVSVRKPTKAIGDEFAAWATANNGEMARRLGIMYIIWDSQMWRTYAQERGWTEYSGCKTRYTTASYDTTCHRDHMHISMTWHGAGADTSWFDGTPILLEGCRASASPVPASPGSAAAPSVIFDPLAGKGTSRPCYLDSSIQSVKLPVAGASAGGRESIQRLRISGLSLNAPSEVRIWSSAGSVSLPQGTKSPTEVSLRLGSDGVVNISAKVGQASLKVEGIGQALLLAPGKVFQLPVAGRAGIPADAEAVSLNLAVTQPATSGYITAFPCGSPRPSTSTLNFAAGQTVANSAIVPLGAGAVCVFSISSAHLVVDYSGYFPAGSALRTMAPERLLDTRTAGVKVPAGGDAAVALPAGAAAAALNVTVTQPSDEGWVAAYPCGTATPKTSSANFLAGQTVANGVVATAGANGKVCIRSSAAAHVIVDINSVLPPGSGFTAMTPKRLGDSRLAPGRRIAPPTDFAITPAAGGAAVAMNLTVVGSSNPGWAVIYPCGSAAPNSSSVNFSAGQTVANGALVKVGADGRVCVRTSAATHVVTDLSGAFAASLFRPSDPVRLFDSRRQ